MLLIDGSNGVAEHIRSIRIQKIICMSKSWHENSMYKMYDTFISNFILMNENDIFMHEIVTFAPTFFWDDFLPQKFSLEI